MRQLEEALERLRASILGEARDRFAVVDVDALDFEDRAHEWPMEVAGALLTAAKATGTVVILPPGGTTPSSFLREVQRQLPNIVQTAADLVKYERLRAPASDVAAAIEAEWARPRSLFVSRVGSRNSIRLGVQLEMLPALSRIERMVGSGAKRKRRYYWAASNATKGAVKPGFRVPPFSLNKLVPMRLDAERYLEELRKAEFPHRPPRIGSAFVCPDMRKGGFCDPAHGHGKSGIYEVSVQGNTFLTDSDHYNEVINLVDPDMKDYLDPDGSKALEAARAYWRGSSSPIGMEQPEYVVDGIVTVIRRVA